MAEIKSLKAEISEIRQERESLKKADEAKKQADEAWNKQVQDFGTKYPDVDIEKLADNAKFTKFIKGKAGIPLVELYDDFVEFIGDTEAATIAKIQSNIDRSTSSGKEKGNAGAMTCGLSERQKAIVDDHNRRYPESKMTYKDYADSLKHVQE